MATPSSNYQLAQLNVAKMVAPLDDPRMAGFSGRLAEINAVAEASDGFVWRFIEADGDPPAGVAFGDESLLVNVSVWATVDALVAFTFESAHRELLRDRRQWFTPRDEPGLVLWWVASGHRPSLAEARERLERLTNDGPSADAFTFKQRFAAPLG